MTFEFLNPFIDSLITLIDSFGYFGIFILMSIESSFIPFPSELILVPAGALVALGKMNIFLVFISGVLGSLVGALINYYLAMLLGRRTIDKLIKKYGKAFLLDKDKLDKVDLFFNKHGEITTFIGRLIPGIRQLISLPAGFAKMNLPKFIFFTSLGAGIWSAILIYFGIIFGNNLEIIKQNIDIATIAAILFSLIIIIIYVILRKLKRRKR
jgi:membrane protein DedA with SNARE-associated domain